MRGRSAALAGLVATLLAPMGAWAADVDVRAPQTRVLRSLDTSRDWTVTIGAEGRVEPIFQGLQIALLRPYPIFDRSPLGTPEPFRGPRDGIGIGLIEVGTFQVGPVGQIVLASPGTQGPLPRCDGLGDVPWAVEVGGFARILVGSLAAHARRGPAGLQRPPWRRRRRLRGRRGSGRSAIDAVRRPARHVCDPRRRPARISASIRCSRRHPACRSSTPKAAFDRSERARRRATCGRRNGRRTPFSNTSG